MTRLMLGCIRFYQTRVSPLTPPQCRYFPSCSEYAATAIATHGPLKGVYLGIRRLLRCHPLREGGLDPVPAKQPRAS